MNLHILSAFAKLQRPTTISIMSVHSSLRNPHGTTRYYSRTVEEIQVSL